jgi:sec-independent protein translocase protein TatB
VFDLSPEKLLLIGVIALMVMGPDRLPKAARTLGRTLHQLRSLSGSLQTELNDALAEPRQALNDVVGDLGLPSSIPKIPKVPSARKLVTKALMAPADVGNRGALSARSAASATALSTSEPSTPDGFAVDAMSALPDDPALN